MRLVSRAYIVGIGEETNTGDYAGANMVPSERGLVDFRESETATLVGVLDVGEIIVEVVESSIASSGLISSSSDGSHRD